MSLLSLRLPPGVLANGTVYQSRGRWRSAQLVRFRDNATAPVGGWSQVVTTGDAVEGVPRALVGWRVDDVASPVLAVGTNSNLYVFTAGTTKDITPTALNGGNVGSEFAAGAYGQGVYGHGKYGVPDTTQTTETRAAIWHLDTFGNYLVGVLQTSDGTIYAYDPADDESEALDLADFVATFVDPPTVIGEIPAKNAGIVVTQERFLLALGAGGDQRSVKWPSQETLHDWEPTETNTAGDFRLPGEGRIICGRRGKNETLIFTDNELFAAQYIGGTLVYGFQQLGSGCGIIGPNAAAVVDGKAIWMGQKGFFGYDGFVRALPSDVGDFVFSDFNYTQREKCFAVPMATFGEIWFHYPSAKSNEPNRYVIYNHVEGHWSLGEMERTAGIDRGAFDFPLRAVSDGTIWEHESDVYHPDVLHGGVLTPRLESGPVELGEGDRVLLVSQLYPDERTLGAVQVYFAASFFPTEEPTAWVGPYSLSNPTDLRLTGRQVRVRLEETTPADWRVGVFRLDVIPGGFR